MSHKPPANRPTRKITNETLIRLSSLGYSVAAIGREANCDPSTISLRLSALGLSAADARKAFMEDVCNTFTTEQLQWLSTKVSPDHTIKDYVRELIAKEFSVESPQTQEGPTQ